MNIERKDPVNCRILKTSSRIPDPQCKIWKTSVKIPGPVSHKIWKTSSKIPDPQSQVVHVNKLKLIHAEPVLEESSVPDGKDPPVDPTVVDWIRLRRVVKKPVRIANDYVFNLLSDNQKANALWCHLCGHPPFTTRRLWKGHLFVVHGVKSAQALTRKVDAVQQGGERPSLPVKEESSSASPPVFEDISEDESLKGLDVDTGRCAIVASMFCGPSESPVGESEHTSGSAREPELLIVNEEIKFRELAIIETLMRRIDASAQTSLSMSLVSSMKRDFPQLTTERIYAPFVWTVWMSRQRAGISSSAPQEDPLPPSEPVAGDSSVPFEGFECIPKVSSEYDPLLGQANSRAVRTPAAYMRDVACRLETVVSELDSPVRVSVLDTDRKDTVAGMNVMFPDYIRTMKWTSISEIDLLHRDM